MDLTKHLKTKKPDDLDLKARQVIMSAYLYYYQDSPILSDAKFDEYCKELADNWDHIIDIRQYQLGSPDQIRASGFHILISVASEGGAWAWHQATFGRILPKDMISYPDCWAYSSKFRCHFTTTNGNKPKNIQ